MLCCDTLFSSACHKVLRCRPVTPHFPTPPAVRPGRQRPGLCFLLWNQGLTQALSNTPWNTTWGEAYFFIVSSDKTMTSTRRQLQNIESYRICFWSTCDPVKMPKFQCGFFYWQNQGALQHSCHFSHGHQRAVPGHSWQWHGPVNSLQHKLILFRTCVITLESFFNDYLLAFLLQFHLPANGNPLLVINIRWATDWKMSLVTQTCRLMCPLPSASTSVPSSPSSINNIYLCKTSFDLRCNVLEIFSIMLSLLCDMSLWVASGLFTRPWKCRWKPRRHDEGNEHESSAGVRQRGRAPPQQSQGW